MTCKIVDQQPDLFLIQPFLKWRHTRSASTNHSFDLGGYQAVADLP
nr:hypothetical protein [Effusibacillus pohliae]